ncbi:hypothetical protein KQI84_09145 [bacterium]|nr:hypothetical protein [bacterium]
MWKERITPPVRSLAGAIGLLGILLLALAHFGAGPVDAQSSTDDDTTTNYSLLAVDQIVPRQSGVSVEEVIPFGKDNVYLVATTAALIVFRVDTSDGTAVNVRIGEIPLTSAGYDEIIVLDDMASFLVRNDKGVAVFSVAKNEVLPARLR